MTWLAFVICLNWPARIQVVAQYCHLHMCVWGGGGGGVGFLPLTWGRMGGLLGVEYMYKYCVYCSIRKSTAETYLYLKDLPLLYLYLL